MIAEVHQLSMVVFDFLEYGVLLLCQRSGQFLLMANYQLCGNIVLTAVHHFTFVRSNVARIEVSRVVMVLTCLSKHNTMAQLA